MSFGKPLHLRLFLEGQEVPVISAQVQVNMWAPATAAIQIVPLDSALNFKPRTMVHLFFLEAPRVTKTQERISLTSDLNGPLGDTAYKLLFCGEVVGFSFVKTPMSRAVILQCLDHSSYWDQLQATMMDYGPQGNAFVHKASLYASNEALFANVPTQSQAEKLRYWILGKPKTPGWEKVAGLAGGILHMMEVMAGLRGWRLGVNDFYSLAELRCHLLSQLSAEDGDSTSQNLLDISVFFDWIYNNLQNQPGQICMRDLMKMLCTYIYYQVVPNPVAKFDPADEQPKTVKYSPKDVKLASHKYFSSCLSVVVSAMRTLRMENEGLTKNDAEQLLGKVSGTLVKQVKEMQGVPPALIDQSSVLEAQLKALVQNFSPTSGARLGAYNMAQTLYDQFVASQGAKITQPGGSYQVSELARLRTQIFRPDCYMAAPPTCNVIFPEHFTQMAYDRSFVQECTRVEISYYSHVIGKDELTAAHFVEPNMRNAATEVAKHLDNKWRILMDHELHTGIIAHEEWLPDSFSHLRKPTGATAEKLKQASVSWTHRTGLHHFFKYRIGQRTMNVAGRFMPYLVCGFPGLVIQRPFYVQGDQAGAIDRILKSTNPAIELGAPPQFLGMVEGFTHSVGQDGGNTQLSMSHCRSHLGVDDEFVGVVLDSVRKKKTLTHPVFYALSYDAVKDDETRRNFLRNCTPQEKSSSSSSTVTDRALTKNEATYFQKTVVAGKETTKKKSVVVTAAYETKNTKAGSSEVTTATNPSGAAGTTVKVPTTPGLFTVGSRGLLGGRIKLIEVGRPYDVVEDGTGRFFRSIIVYEEVTATYADDAPIPVEYIVQPSWLSTSYDNENVGPKVYQKFFGCDSIVDMISLSDVGSIPERLNEKGMYVTTEEDEAAVKARLSNISSKRNFYSIEKAVNLIAYLYGRARSEGVDVDEFVSTYIWRPVATKLDLLGAHDLEVSVQGTEVKTKGVVGFHTLSVHPTVVGAGKLVGLLKDPTVKMARMNTKQMEAMKASYDVRADKLAKVLDYVTDLKRGARGFVG